MRTTLFRTVSTISFLRHSPAILLSLFTRTHREHHRVLLFFWAAPSRKSLRGPPTIPSTTTTPPSPPSPLTGVYPSSGRWDLWRQRARLRGQQDGLQERRLRLQQPLLQSSSYPGPVADALYTPGWWPAPNTQAKCASGKGVLPSIVSTWGKSSGSFNYTNVYPTNALAGVDVGPVAIGANDAGSSSPAPASAPPPAPAPAPARRQRPPPRIRPAPLPPPQPRPCRTPCSLAWLA